MDDFYQVEFSYGGTMILMVPQFLLKITDYIHFAKELIEVRILIPGSTPPVLREHMKKGAKDDAPFYL
ncbi:MAG: hypothetical protein AB1499_11100 [Nitrospirota bacterium]